MEQRLAFVVQWLKHETSMAELCRAFGISRQTGYELVAHFQADGIDGLKPHSRAPRQHPNAVPAGGLRGCRARQGASSELGTQEAPATA